MKLWNRYIHSLTGHRPSLWDVLDEVPVNIGIERYRGHWYLSALFGQTLEDHAHVEIKLDAARLAELAAAILKAMEQQREEKAE